MSVLLIRISRSHTPHVEIDRSLYPVAGIDVSSHNGTVDFSQVASDGFAFAYLKASEGASMRDPSFSRFHSDARRCGTLRVGAYHFFRFDVDGRSQAINFLSAIDGRPLDLPLAIDVEEWGNPAGITTETVRNRLSSMVDYLRSRGHRVIVYTNKNGFGRILENSFDYVDVWICSFTDPPMVRKEWRLWQHSHKGRVKGIRGDVDMNTFNGTYDDFENWCTSDPVQYSGENDVILRASNSSRNNYGQN